MTVSDLMMSPNETDGKSNEGIQLVVVLEAAAAALPSFRIFGYMRCRFIFDSKPYIQPELHEWIVDERAQEVGVLRSPRLLYVITRHVTAGN